MINKDIVNALIVLAPGAQWVVRGDTLDGIEWLDTVQTRPADDEINAAIGAYIPPPSVQDQLAALQAQVAALLAAQGK